MQPIAVVHGRSSAALLIAMSVLAEIVADEGDERAARKSHQADRIAVELCEQIERSQLRTLQPVWLHIRCQHALGGIDGDQDVQAAAVRDLRRIPALRSRQSDADAQCSSNHSATLEPDPRS